MAGKVKYYELTDKERRKFLKDFYSAVVSLKTEEDAKTFFKDLLTSSEITMISRRIQIAKKLLSNCTHEEIKKELKVGFTTISNVERWLNNGFGGYKKVLNKFEEQNKNKKMKNNFSESLLNKYPQHRWLVNLFKD
jgi:TrpR-related protein YerC/YecD